MKHMKYIILLSLFVSVAQAGECKLTGITQTCQRYETKFELQGADACKDLAKKTKNNNFFNFIESHDQLVKTLVSYKEESIQKDEIEFNDGDCT